MPRHFSGLTFFIRHGEALSEWLDRLDPDISLYNADDDALLHLASAVDFEPHTSITLLSKVLYRKRPKLIPLLDRHVIDWYRPLTKERSSVRA